MQQKNGLKHKIKRQIGMALLLLVFAYKPSFGQAVSVQGDFVAAAADVYGNVYAIDAQLNLIKYSKKLDTIRVLSVSNLGNNPCIDASNPLEVFVFFGSTGKVVWFDNQLNQQSVVDLFGAGISKPVGFGRANDGNIWVLDNNNNTLKKVNREGNLVVESVAISNFVPQKEVTKIWDDGENIIIADDSLYAYIFNRNLLLQERVKIPYKLLGIEGDYFIGSKDSAVYKYTYRLGTIKQQKIETQLPPLTGLLQKTATILLCSSAGKITLQPISE